MRFGKATFDRRQLGAQAVILLISTIAVAVWVNAKPIVFADESFAYVDFARELQLGKPSSAEFLRYPLFPAILWAFHVTDLSHSVSRLLLFHSFLAVASCWLFYLTARLLHPRGAFILALVFIASLLPFLQVKHIVPDQTFFFETVLSLYGLVAYLMARTKREALISITVLGTGTALMMLTKPQGAYVVPLLFGLVAVLAWRRVWISLLSAVIVLAAVWSVYVVEKKAFSGSEAAKGSFSIWRRIANVPQEGSTPRRERLSLERGLRAYFDPLMLSVPLHPQFDAEVFRPPLSDEILAAGDYANATDVDRAIDENLRLAYACVNLGIDSYAADRVSLLDMARHDRAACFWRLLELSARARQQPAISPCDLCGSGEFVMRVYRPRCVGLGAWRAISEKTGDGRHLIDRPLRRT
jgi:hypothetical protein